MFDDYKLRVIKSNSYLDGYLKASRLKLKIDPRIIDKQGDLTDVFINRCIK